MCDAVILPCKIVKALAHETSKSLVLCRLEFLFGPGLHGEGFCLGWLEIRLENHDVSVVIRVVVGVHRLADQFLARRIADMNFRQILLADGRELRRSQLNGLAETRAGQLVDGGDDQLVGCGKTGRRNGRQP